MAITPPPARHRQRVPASIFLWFSYGFPHFQPWAGGNNTSAGPPPAAGARFHFPVVFLWFSTLSALGRWLCTLCRPAAAVRCPLPFSFGFPHFQPWAGGSGTSAGPPPPAGARFHFPMVFHTFSPGPVAVVPPPARHRQPVPASIFLWFSCGFPHFQPWAGGCSTSASPRTPAHVGFHFPVVFLWFSTLSALGRWL